MAVNQKDIKSLIKKIIPKVDYLVTSSGLQILCDRITTPRILKFDLPSKCKSCLKVALCIAKHGVWVDCSRIKGLPFVPFDIIRDFPKYTIFRFKARGSTFPIPHSDSDSEHGEEEENTNDDPLFSSSQRNLSQNGIQTPTDKNKKSMEPNHQVSEILPQNEDNEIIFLGESKGNREEQGGGIPASKLPMSSIKQEPIDEDENMVQSAGRKRIAVVESDIDDNDEEEQEEHDEPETKKKHLDLDDDINRTFWAATQKFL